MQHSFHTAQTQLTLPARTRVHIPDYRFTPVIQTYQRLLALRDECDDHAVEVVKEGKKVKAELEEALLFVPWESAEYLRRVVHVVLISYFVDVVC